MVFTDVVTADKSSRMNSEVYWTLICSDSAKLFRTDRTVIHSTDG